MTSMLGWILAAQECHVLFFFFYIESFNAKETKIVSPFL